jgi:hypothetical protein
MQNEKRGKKKEGSNNHRRDGLPAERSEREEGDRGQRGGKRQEARGKRQEGGEKREITRGFRLRAASQTPHTHTPHIYIRAYMYVYMYVYICICMYTCDLAGSGSHLLSEGRSVRACPKVVDHVLARSEKIKSARPQSGSLGARHISAPSRPLESKWSKSSWTYAIISYRDKTV